MTAPHLDPWICGDHHTCMATPIDPPLAVVADPAELSALRREVARLRQERDALTDLLLAEYARRPRAPDREDHA